MGPSNYTPDEFSHKQRTQLINYHNMEEKTNSAEKPVIKHVIEPVTKCSNCVIT